MKTITGFLAILIGGVGMLITLVVVVAVWVGAFMISSQVEQVASQADQSLTQVEEAVGRLQERLATTAKSVEAARASAAKVARERPNATATKAEVGSVQTNLLQLTEQGIALREALPPLAQLIDNAANVAEKTGGQPHADRLRSIAGNLREAEKGLSSVSNQTSAIRSGESKPTAKELESLAGQTGQSLDLLTTALVDTKKESESLRKDLPEARNALDKWKVTGAGITTGILLWIGLGQLAIIAWGRRRLADRYVVASQPTATAK